MMPAKAGWILAAALAVIVSPVFAQSTATSDFEASVQALRAGDMDVARAAVAHADPVERDLLEWLHLRDADAEPQPFEVYTSFLDKRPGWPGLTRIRAAAERSLDATIPTAATLAFFEGQDVETGDGAVAYARALIAAGRPAEAETVIAALWTTSALTDEGHQAIIDAFPDVVAPLHSARMDMLLWRWRTSDAENTLPLLDEGEAALARARIGYITGAPDQDARVDVVPARFGDTPGLAYDRFNWLADRSEWTQASDLLLARSTDAEALGVPWRWGSWRRILARWQMREGNADKAYALAADHFIAPEDRNYADLEWLAGYIALTYLQDAPRALRHFQAFDAVVTSPISKGRAGYWLGRAYDAQGDEAAAVAAYQNGALHQTSFYGLLSAERLGLTMDPDLVGGETFGDWRTSPVIRSDLVRAGLALLAAGERGSAVLFFRDAARGMSRQDVGQLGQMLMEIDEPFYTVLVAKTAAREGTLVQDAYFPFHPMADLDLPVERALALSIARQESEFRVDAGSAVGALGLMQLMPGTASDVAGWLDLPYSRSRLTTDWQYNVALGSEYLAYLTREFGNSPVMIAAGYNAGPGRPRQWISDRGDPRRNMQTDSGVDVVDWIEHIPFRETRNYVMRVTEGIPIYRARLTGRVAPVRFTDLLIGEVPVLRPVARPERPLPPQTEARSVPAPTGPQAIRPVARAGE